MPVLFAHLGFSGPAAAAGYSSPKLYAALKCCSPTNEYPHFWNTGQKWGTRGVSGNVQKRIVITAVTVTPPAFGEFGKGPLSETPKLMSPGRCLAILLAASTASLIGST